MAHFISHIPAEPLMKINTIPLQSIVSYAHTCLVLCALTCASLLVRQKPVRQEKMMQNVQAEPKRSAGDTRRRTRVRREVRLGQSKKEIESEKPSGFSSLKEKIPYIALIS